MIKVNSACAQLNLILFHVPDITEPAISIPGGNEVDSFFAPISPAASSHQQKQHLHHQLQPRVNQQNLSSKGSVSLLEMLQRGSTSDSQPIPSAEIPSIRDLGLLAIIPINFVCLFNDRFVTFLFGHNFRGLRQAA